jgi:acetylornithine deacetylase/succinyl-diaminopimelate desuccinylase-like protein
MRMPPFIRLLPASLLVACAAALLPPPRTPSVREVVADAPPSRPCPRSTALDAAALHDEVVCLLQHYVQLDTTNPPGNELHAAAFLAAVLAREGIDSQIIQSAPGRGNLYARLPGRGDEKPLVLMHHMDVVPADADDWTVPPLSGELRDGELWGRGSIDNKGGGVVGLMTILMAKRLGAALPRDLILLGVADEEAGGGLGVRWLLQHRPELFADVGSVLNEGGAIIDMGHGRLVYSVERAQKAPLWLRITASGTSGHGSIPRDDAATHVLARALGRLAAHRFELQVLPEVQALFSARAQAMPPSARAPFMDLRRSLADPAFRETFLGNPRDAALVRNTLSITRLTGSDKENVLPARASAVLDLRLLPGQDPAAVTAQVVEVMAEPSLQVETLLSWQAHASAPDTPMFAAIEALASRNDPGAPVIASVIQGFTDCNAFRAEGIPCYGFTPIRLGLPEIGRIHGKDERVSVTALTRAIVDMATLVWTPAGGK